MITPDLVEELTIWLHDPFFLENVRPFNRVHKQNIRFEYDPFLHENRLEFHTGMPYLLQSKIKTDITHNQPSRCEWFPHWCFQCKRKTLLCPTARTSWNPRYRYSGIWSPRGGICYFKRGPVKKTYSYKVWSLILPIPIFPLGSIVITWSWFRVFLIFEAPGTPWLSTLPQT